ncbi:TonB-dependent receptor [Aquimarina megaterium]|uniref:TonB-dependent receptor n=1 Tax=Aquimarina megaterium TaxID=1443666 RepID=UPI000942BAD9|nr:TonB-dependent receptor [Aquimarina megaterium]
MKTKNIVVFSALLFTTIVFAQTKIQIKGIVNDGNSPLWGVNVLIKEQNIGTITNDLGQFMLETESEFPIVLEISYLGFNTKEVTVTKDNTQNLSITLDEGAFQLDVIVVGASRHKERFIEAPVSIQKVDAKTLEVSSAEGVFETLSNLKGVQVIKGSLSGPSINTRGFSNNNNIRFLQHLDGMDVTTPGFGVFANIGGVSSLDISSIEIIPGSASALYGANAFNGIMLLKTKDPFIHQGISINLKSGFSSQEESGNNPYTNLNLRAAKAFGDKFAIKVDFELLLASDWIANDYSLRVRNNDPNIPADRNPELYSPSSGSYDAVNIWGDADAGGFTRALTDGTSLTIAGTPTTWNDGTVSRTGYKESELFDNDVSNYRLNTTLQYKISDDWRLEYLYKYGNQDLIVRHTTSYPHRDFTLQHHKVELRGDGLTARWYYSDQEAKNSWTTTFLAASIQTQLLSNQEWGQRYAEAYLGVVNGIAANDGAAARSYADAPMALPGSSEWNEARDRSLATSTTFPQNPGDVIGSRLVEKSSFWHSDLIYNFNETLIKDDTWEAIFGANYRQYNINSDGAFFNDNRDTPNGFKGDITNSDFGVFGQVSKKMLKERLKLSLAARFNKNTNFDGNITPQASAVYSLGEARNHNLRASFQTGVRNPGLQEQYINFLVSPVFVILGGTDDNLDHYTDEFYGITGDDLKTLLRDQLGYDHKGLDPETNTTFDFGYRGLFFNKRLLIDANYYTTTYKKFIERANLSVTVPGGPTKTHAIYANIQDDVVSRGFGVNLEYSLSGNYRTYFNYQWMDFEQKSNTTTNGFVVPAFNTPPNRINLGISKSNRDGGLGFDFALRWVDEYDFISPMGKGFIDSFVTMDASLFYKIKQFNLTLAGSNITKNEYKTVYGGPEVGALYTLGVRWDLGL